MTSRSRAISANGLRLAMLRGAQACHRIGIRRVAGELIAAQPLHRHDVPAPQQRGGVLDRGASARSACGTRDRLGMEPPVLRVPVLGKACVAKRERRHRGRRAVIGNAVDDAEPRSAPRAVGKAIAVASLRRIEHLARAFDTDRGIGSDLGACRAGGTIDDAEARRAAPAERLRSIRSMWASGGGSRRIRSSSAAIAPLPPATRISTPSASFRTSPDRPSSRAIRQTVGRNPTPCTRPRTLISATSIPTRHLDPIAQLDGRNGKRGMKTCRCQSGEAVPPAAG